jgi:hypothetical protein
LPIRVDKMFEPEYDFTPLLSIKVGSVILNCHFFTGREIDFDFDPREITSEFQAAQVFTFIHQIGKLLNKEVIVTPSNYQSYVIFKFSPCIGQSNIFRAECDQPKHNKSLHTDALRSVRSSPRSGRGRPRSL